MRRVSFILGAAVSAVAGTAWGHHSFAMFDQTTTKELVGVVKEVQWTNPHIWVQVLVKDDKSGQPVEWSIEGGSPNALARQGWRRASIKAGDAIALTIHPLKDGSNGGSLMKAMVNGQPVGGSVPAPAPVGAAAAAQ